MDLKIILSKVCGNPNESGWSQIHDFVPEDSEKYNKRGRLIAIISIRHQDGELENITQGREIISRIHEEYYGNLESSAFEGLKNSVSKVFEEFKGQYDNLQIAATSFVDGVVYTAVVNGAQASIYRNHMLAKILEGQKNEVVSASGYPQDGDVFVVGTKSFFESFSDGMIKASLAANDPAKAVESYAPQIHSLEDGSQLAAALISFFIKEKGMPDLIGKEPEEVEIQKEHAGMSNLGFVQKIAELARKTGALVPKRRIYIKSGVSDLESIKNKKTTLSVGVILIFLLLVSIGFGIKQKVQKDKKLGYQDNLTQAQHNLEEAENIAKLNPSRARELFLQSRDITQKLTVGGVKDKDLDSLIEKIDQQQAAILGEYDVQPELYIDLTLLSSGFGVDRLVADVQDLLVLDKSSKKIAKANIATKKAEVVAGPADFNKNVIDIALYSGRVFALSDDGLYEVGGQKDRLFDNDLGTNLNLYSYAGNIYILDKDASKIYRYPAVDSGFGSRQEWIAPGIDISLSGVSGWSIDGSIWLAFDSGKILKLTQGSPSNIDTTGVSPELKSIRAIYTNEELGHLYLLDTDNKRVVVLDKDGNYVAQYIDDKLASAGGIVASGSAKKLIFSDNEGKLYSIELKHLE
jgi:hypothetical protein